MSTYELVLPRSSPLQFEDFPSCLQPVRPTGGVVQNDVVGNWLVPEGNYHDWLATFTLPTSQHKCETLRGLHPMVRDARISFREQEHVYIVDGMQVPLSVTGFLALFHEPFDADVAIEKMMSGGGWLRRLEEEFTHIDGAPWTKGEIKTHWERNGCEARGRGTLMHWHIEQHLNGQRIGEPKSPEFQLFERYEQDFLIAQGIRPLRTEFSMFHVGLGIAGQADFLGVAPCGGIVLVDWKRSKQIRGSNSFQKMRHPLGHLDDCNLMHYWCQLNLYKYILESEYNMKVMGMFACVLHPAQKTYQNLKVPDMIAEMSALVLFAREKFACSLPRPGAHAEFRVYSALQNLRAYGDDSRRRARSPSVTE